MNIEYIRNMGCLRNIDSINLGRNIFIYGLNGVGKSTLKKLVKASFDKKIKIKPSFGMRASQASAKLRILNKNIEFASGKVINPIENIELHVFDDEYIESIIFENGLIKDENKINYYNILVGNNISKKVKILNDKSLSNQQFCREADAMISKLENEMIIMEKIYHQYENISNLLKFKYQPIEFADENYVEEVLKNVSYLGETEVRWLNQGINIRKSKDICPFCGQNVSEDIQELLINRYEELNIKYKNDEKSAQKVIHEYISSIKELIELEDSVYIDLSDEKIKEDIKTILDYCNEKEEDLAKVMLIPKLDSIGVISKKLFYVKEQIETLKIVVQKYRISDMFDISIDDDAETKYKNLRASVKNLFINAEEANDFLSIISQIRKTALSCGKKINEIATEQYNLINGNIDYINEKFKEYDFNYILDFKNVKHKILKNSNDFLLNLSLIPKSNPTLEVLFDKKYIKDCLSEGEKSIIAWVIFLCEIRQQFKEKRHFIILDDPISSYDAYRRFNLIFDLENIFINNSIDKEILLLTHERSFTNSAKFIKKMNFFNLRDNKLVKVDPENIIEDDMRDDIDFIRKHTILQNDETFIEFLVRSRNLIDYSKLNSEILGTRFFKISKYKVEYNNVSSVIHMRNNNLPISYINYVEKVFYKIVRNNIVIDYSSIDLTNIDLRALLPQETDNPYINRVLLDNYFQDVLIANRIAISYSATTGELLDKVKQLITDDKVKKTRLILPILNIFNHPNLNYGVRRIDIDFKKKNLVKRLVNQIIN